MIPLFKVAMSEGAVLAATDVLNSGYVGQGLVADQFEEAFTRFADHPQGFEAVLMNSCTSAITAVLTHLGVGPGDEVITTPLTCIATNSPILAVGARPVWADVDPLTGILSPSSVGEKITGRTKAIIAVDWAGMKANYGALRDFGLPVIQDAAHNPDASFGLDDVADYVCYSFGPIKHLCCVDGGAVLCRPDDARSLRLLRWYGLDRTSSTDYRCAQSIYMPGQKWHMTDLNAAIGLANLQHLPLIMSRHRSNAFALHRGIQSKMVELPPFDPTSGWWFFPLLLPARRTRNEMKDFLEQRGIAASQVHARNDKHPAYNFPNGPLPGLDEYTDRHLNIPCGWWVTQEDLEQIITAVSEFK